jgi:hypothetical protein
VSANHSANGLEPYLTLALQRLDALLELEMRRLRARYQLSLDEQRGLYISDEQVDQLVRSTGVDQVDHRSEELAALAEGLRERCAATLHESPRCNHLAHSFGLRPFELDVLLLALAPEVNLKYQTIYAYLNDAVAKKWPTRDLALRLFAGESATLGRAALASDGTLFRDGLLEDAGSSAEAGAWLAGAFTAAEAVTHFALGVEAVGNGPSAAVRMTRPSLAWDDAGLDVSTRRVLQRVPLLRDGQIVMLEGHEGSGRSRAAHALACQERVPLITIDLNRARVTADALTGLLQDALLQQRLHGAIMHVASGDLLVDRDGPYAADMRAVVDSLAKRTGIVLVSVSPDARWREALGATRHVAVGFGTPPVSERLRLWRALRPEVPPDQAAALKEVADRFAFTPGQIERASAAVDDRLTLEQSKEQAPDKGLFFDAARAESRRGLAAIGALATRTTTTAEWSSLVLPTNTMTELRELINAIRFRGTVYDDWKMASRNSGARGVRALFSGVSGTGKTTSAAIIAGKELFVDLYTVDLSAVTSKYIGETEKNLDQIFRAARDSSAILFFDEADALFGKRSEVKDAHDRYSNIEVAYLLQKIDQHDGTVLLATNLANNLDQGFSRRMHYTIEFPLPNAADRERIWRGMFPEEAPIAQGIDFGFLARQFNLAGGDIRNVALSAAFSAAAEHREIEMRDLVRAMARQVVKQGRSPSAVDFGLYFGMLAE